MGIPAAVVGSFLLSVLCPPVDPPLPVSPHLLPTTTHSPHPIVLFSYKHPRPRVILSLFFFFQDEVFGSSYSAAIYISRILSLPPTQKTVFVLGESGIETELDSESIPHIGGTDPAYNRIIGPNDYTSIASGQALDPSVGVVLAGLDFHLNYLKLAYAFAYLQRGAKFCATNMDTTLPSAGSLFPGGGAISAPLTAMMGGEKPMAFGKPSQAMMDAIEGKFKFDRKKACMVGDRLDTDIRFGIEGGLGGTLCVLTGVTKSEKEWEGEGKEVVPTAWVKQLGDLRG